MKFVERLLQRTSSWIGLGLLLILQVFLGWKIGSNVGKLVEISGGNGILDFEIGYSAQKVHAIFASYGSEGMDVYRSIQFFDLFNPMVYSLIVASLMFLMVRGTGFLWLVFLPLLAGLLDYVENGFIFVMANTYPDIPNWIIESSSALSLIKRGIMFLMVIALIFAFFRWLRNKYNA